VVAAVAFAVYANTLWNGFLNDDEHQVLLNPWITDLRSLPAIFTQSVWGFVEGKRVSDYYRPLMHVVYLIDHQIFGFRAWGFHLVNVILHALNTALVFFLTKRLTAGSGAAPADPTTPADFLLAAPFAAALLFATHPVHTEAVAWSQASTAVVPVGRAGWRWRLTNCRPRTGTFRCGPSRISSRRRFPT